MNPHDPLTRRTLLKTIGTGAALLGVGALRGSARAADAARPTGAKPAAAGTAQPFTLPELGYAYAALEPHIDARTMEIHHTKHHKAYIDNANKALAAHPALQKLTAEAILRDLGAVPEGVRTTLRNHVGGHVNHAFFWQVIAPAGGGIAGGPVAQSPSGALGEAIARRFGSFDAFKAQFADAATKRFGSGWAWLVVKAGKLEITSTANQDSPLSDGATPVLGLDVWEHAYYLKYQSARGDYVKAFWNVLNWSQAAANFAAA